MEGHRDGRPHLHNLVFGTAALDHLALENLWTEISGGIARVKVFREGGGACEYCVKGTRYVSKEGNLALLGPWRALRGEVHPKGEGEGPGGSRIASEGAGDTRTSPRTPRQSP